MTGKLHFGCLKRSEAFLPCALEAARDEAVVWIDGTIAALGKACRIARPLDAKPPVLQRGLPVGLEPLGGSQRRCDLGRLERGNESARTASSICTPPIFRQ